MCQNNVEFKLDWSDPIYIVNKNSRHAREIAFSDFPSQLLWALFPVFQFLSKPKHLTKRVFYKDEMV